MSKLLIACFLEFFIVNVFVQFVSHVTLKISLFITYYHVMNAMRSRG